MRNGVYVFLFFVALVVFGAIMSNDQQMAHRLDVLEAKVSGFTVNTVSDESTAFYSTNDKAYKTDGREPIYTAGGTDIRFVESGAGLVPVNGRGKEIDSDLCFHEIHWDSGLRRPIGRYGSMSYVLDSSGRKVSKGYHKFFLKDGRIWGAIGATEEEVRLKD